jgi:hypothetical protein
VRLAGFSASGLKREVLAVDRPDGSILLLDCRAPGLRDARVIAHLERDEPPENAQLLARMYVCDPDRGRPRRLTREDLAPRPRALDREQRRVLPLTAAGRRFAIAAVALPRGAFELRWTSATTAEGALVVDAVSLRDTIGSLEAYEPARTFTATALDQPRQRVSVVRLRGELARVDRSPIVLNRGLREAVARRVAEGVTLSEIAMRCGRFKSDRNGQRSGETSWLSRRIGQMPDGGQSRPTPWIHTDTLALIARAGLGMSPHEVEL